MPAKTFFVRNATTGPAVDVEIEDLGIILEAGIEVDLLADRCQIHDVIESCRNGDLDTAITAGDVEVIASIPAGPVIAVDDIFKYWVSQNHHDALVNATGTLSASNGVVADDDGRLLPKLTANGLTDPASIVAADIDDFAVLDITTTAPQSYTLPTPTAAGQPRLLYVCHNDDSSSSLDVNGSVIGAGQCIFFIWDGDFWHAPANQASPTLDQVYDAGSKVITADSGPIDLIGYTTEAPFRIAPTGTAPSANLSDGEIFMGEVGGKPMLFVYDDGRGKWLSDSIMKMTFTRDQNVDSGYLHMGDQLGRNSGDVLPFDATIIAVTVRIAAGNDTKVFNLRSNGSPTNLDTYTLPSANQLVENNSNIDLSSGDYPLIFVAAAGAPVRDPVVTIYYSWRL